MYNNTVFHPLQAVMLLWSAAGHFGKDDPANGTTIITGMLASLKTVSEGRDKEQAYLQYSELRLTAALRNAEMIYKGRQLNYEENIQLRKAYLESLQEDHTIQGQLKDALKSLPAITIGGSGGIALIQTAGDDPGTAAVVFSGLIFGAIGFIVKKLFSQWLLSRKQRNNIRQDYETSAYYEHYLNRMESLMISVADDLNAAHRDIIGNSPAETDHNTLTEAVKELLSTARPVSCPCLHEHIRKNLIRPNLWHLCETGLPRCRNCRHFPTGYEQNCRSEEEQN
ncbi:MAG: hypothetical protein ACOYXB_04545 [Bacteroidota bacterium]